jgi:Ca2+-binding RTX toxin-like protein
LLNDDENSAVIVRSTAHIGDPDGPVEYTAAIDAVYGRVGDDRVYIENIDLNQGIQIHNGEGSDRLGTINPDIDFIYTPLEPAVGAMNYTDGARLYGDGGDDLLMGTYRSDWLEGGVGNDMLRGYSGDDFVFGNEDDDVLDGRMGEDSLFGGQGVDALYGGEGADYLEGGGGDDDGLFVNARHDPVRLLPHCRPRYQENPSW